MQQIISGVVVIVAVVAGAYGGVLMRPSSGDIVSAHENKADKADSPGKKTDSHDSGSEEYGVEFYKFSREFVVPVLMDGRVASLVILNINLEIEEGQSQKIFSVEPKIRDNILNTLIEISGDNMTFSRLNSVESHETIRSMVLANLKNIAPDDIINVLIIDMAKQDL